MGGAAPNLRVTGGDRHLGGRRLLVRGWLGAVAAYQHLSHGQNSLYGGLYRDHTGSLVKDYEAVYEEF